MNALRIYLRANRTDRRGQSAIYFIVDDQWTSTGIKCAPRDWDPINCVICKTHPRYYQVSPQLLLFQSRAENYISNLILEGKRFNKQYFAACIRSGKEAVDNPCFLKLMDEFCNSDNLSLARIKHYNELKKDIIAVATRPKLYDINFNFATRLKKYLQTKKDKPNKDNTIIRKFKQLKAVVHYAQKCGLLTVDPLAMIKLKQIKGNKEHLNASELQQLQQLYDNNSLPGHLQTCLQYFLFSCYTGLRFSDIVKLENYNMMNNCIRFTQQKTDKPVFVPLVPQAQKLITPQPYNRLFKTFANQPTNRWLKEIMIIAGIEKHISYHCSRHTFGTLSILWGIPKEVVAEIMGVDMHTVNVYAKMLEEVKIREMDKWRKAAG